MHESIKIYKIAHWFNVITPIIDYRLVQNEIFKSNQLRKLLVLKWSSGMSGVVARSELALQQGLIKYWLQKSDRDFSVETWRNMLKQLENLFQ